MKINKYLQVILCHRKLLIMTKRILHLQSWEFSNKIKYTLAEKFLKIFW